uniref:Sulfide:quinone oxidoreductase, mitochondrial n=1 Tax=Strongyloides venezuelensis TaxID=75913 RepID=A0A0K0FFK1_STRVS
MKLSSYVFNNQHFKLLILGGGSGGLSVGNYFSSKLPSGSIGIIEPKTTHYYQPGFTLVGGGIRNLEVFKRDECSLISKKINWIQNDAKDVIPSKNTIVTSNNDTITYDYLVVATGCQTRFDKIEGAQEALDSDRSVVSIYLPQYAEKTFKKMKAFDGGNAIFTYPNTPVKCAGAPQKICYLFEDYQRRNGKSDKTNVSYNTSLGKIFGVDRYAVKLMEHVKERNITLNTRRNLTKVDSLKNVATFELLDDNAKGTGKFVEEEFNFLHIGAPCSPSNIMLKSAQSNEGLVDGNGWVDVDMYTLQSKKYQNVFAIGDATNTPNAKTAAAISSQLKALKVNIKSAMDGKEVTGKYTGYGSCPLVISYNKGILAEFNYNGPEETLPIDQSNPSFLFYYMKVNIMPPLYWKGLIKGLWEGPADVRKLLRFGKC